MQPSDAGVYRVQLRNALGITNAYARLSLSPKPLLKISEAMSLVCDSQHNNWWELTNLGQEPVDLCGYRWDDAPGSIGSGPTIALSIIIEPRESIIFTEHETLDEFTLWWGADNLPAHLRCITYQANGFNDGGDQVTLWNAFATANDDYVDSVSFSGAASCASFWFDPDVCPVSEVGVPSVSGQGGAFQAARGSEVGSPGWTRWSAPAFTSINIHPTGDRVSLRWSAQPGSTNRLQWASLLTNATEDGGRHLQLSGPGVRCRSAFTGRTAPAAAFVINTVSYLGIIATLLWWRPTRTRSELPPEPLASAIAAGVLYVGLSPHLLAILLRCLLYTIPIAAVPALMPIVARDLLGGGAPTFGILLGGFGVGAMLGALASATLRSRFTSDTQLRAISAVACVAMIAIGQSRWSTLTLLAHVLAGSVWTLAFANFNIAVQLSSPRWVTGRMLATYQTIAFAGVALGSWWWGEFASAQGLRESLTLAGLSALVSLAAARWLPVSVARLGSLDPRARVELNPPSVEIHPASGPIVVTIEYRVPAENQVQFFAVINELGRIRRRDGATNRKSSSC